jgi:hypothetical protein
VAFEVPVAVMRDMKDPADGPDLWKLLRAAVSRKPLKRGSRLAVADSKVLYDSADHESGLKLLERAALAFLALESHPHSHPHPAPPPQSGGGSQAWGAGVSPAAAGGQDARPPLGTSGQDARSPWAAGGQDARPPLSTLRDLLCRICPAICDELHTYPWYAPSEVRLPVQVSASELGPQRNSLRVALENAGVRFRGAWVEVVPEGHFNRMVEATRNKAVVLFTQTVRLIGRITAALGGRPMRIWGDRHGGRICYRHALMTAFEDAPLQVIDESPEHSGYKIRRREAPFVIRFVMKGESKQLPIALASIYSKYVRELFMLSFNRYWTAQLANLKPTAGYYKDGQRFLAEIDPVIASRRLDRNWLVRVV